MRSLVVLSIVVICTLLSLAGYIYTNSIRYYNVRVINRVAVLPDKGYQYFTEDDLLISVDNEVIDVPKGFSTDLASIPRPLWSIVSPARSELIQASILHDYLYSCPGNSTRLEIDEIYYNILIKEGLSKYIAAKFFIAVRLFGAFHFNDAVECYPNPDEIEWIQEY